MEGRLRNGSALSFLEATYLFRSGRVGGARHGPHTSSYWLAIDDYAAVGGVIDAFRTRYIPSSSL